LGEYGEFLLQSCHIVKRKSAKAVVECWNCGVTVGSRYAGSVWLREQEVQLVVFFC